MTKRREKIIEAPFIWVLKDTLRCPAWRAMSLSARLLYVALKCRLSNDARNNGRVYLSTRVAAKEIGINKNTTMRGFHELAHYGFIAQTIGGCLGVDGRGVAPHWRLTEVACWIAGAKEPASREYERWKGDLFESPKNKTLSEKPGRGVPKTRTVVSQKPGQSDRKLSEELGHKNGQACLKNQDISRIAISGGAGGSEKAEPHTPALKPKPRRKPGKPLPNKSEVKPKPNDAAEPDPLADARRLLDDRKS